MLMPESQDWALGCPQLRHMPKSSRRRSFSISDIILTTFLGIGTLRSYPKPYRQLTVNHLSPLELGKKYCITYLGLYLSKKSINFQKIWALWKALEAIFQMQCSPIFYLLSLQGTTTIIDFSRKTEKNCITYQISYRSKNLINFQKVWAVWKALEFIFYMRPSVIFYH